jgi:hypothetical protein
MKELWNNTDLCVEKELVVPVAVKDARDISFCDELLIGKEPYIPFTTDGVARFEKKGAYVVLDFGKELCGGVRIITRQIVDIYAKVRITLGESLTEACSSIGYKNATNHHAPRDFEADLINMSDLTFGQSGFRFARIELLTETPVAIRNIYGVNTLPVFPRQGYLKTEDELLNQIIETAGYTLKLCCQNGQIWDGIKRDRLIWSGDLNPEILTCLYLFGDNSNIPSALRALRQSTPADRWMNNIPSYSAWWVLNLCDYCRFTGNTAFYEENRDYAGTIMKRINFFVAEDGSFDFGEDPEKCMIYFLDWPTHRTVDAQVGTASMLLYTANQMLMMEENADCRQLQKKLQVWLQKDAVHKQVRAFQILAGRQEPDDVDFLEKDGAKGMSTFMSYYILKADAMAGGTKMIEMIKEYYGAMLSRGATSFWEDFDLAWLEGSGRIDEFPAPGQKDIHGDYGAFCYQQLRHSLCHGWSSGVLAFLYEYLLGVKMLPGGQYHTKPTEMEIKQAEGIVPVPGGMLNVLVQDGKVTQEICA